MATRIPGTVIAVPQTEYWDAATLDRHTIAEAFCLYFVPDDAEETVDVVAYPIANRFHHWHGAPEEDRYDAEVELESEGLEEVSYLMRAEVRDADPRRVARLTVEIEDEDDRNDALTDRQFLTEELYNSPEGNPAILTYATWAEWHRDRTAQRRARNLPPLANWGANGLDNLPLFVAAANAIMEPRRTMIERAAERFGHCTAHRLEKRPLERLGYSWAL